MTNRSKFCRVNYLKDGRYTSEDKEWDKCEVCPVSTYSGYGTQVFTPDQIYQRDALLALLAQAFELGRAHKLQEVQNVLRINL